MGRKRGGKKNLEVGDGSRLFIYRGKSKSDKAEKEVYKNYNKQSIKTRWYIRKKPWQECFRYNSLEQVLFTKYTFHG